MQEPEPVAWAELPDKRGLNKDDFVAQVKGHSMEPKIPDGAWCLFNRNVVGSRNGRILLVQHRDITDPETGGHYTVKVYKRPPPNTHYAFRRVKIFLEPLNADFTPIEITEEVEEFCVIAGFAEVLRRPNIEPC